MDLMVFKEAYREFGWISKKRSVWYWRVRDKSKKNNQGKEFNCRTHDIDEAIRIIQQWLKDGYPSPATDSPDSVLFVDFLESFWREDSEYFRNAQYEGRHITSLTLKNNQGIVKNYAAKFFKRAPLSKINEDMLNDFFGWCLQHPYGSHHRQLSTGFLKKIKTCVVVPLRWARRKKIITHVIDFSVVLPRLGTAHVFHRGILTDDEQYMLLNHQWRSPKAYLAFYIAINCGLRLGEIRALTVADVTPSYIIVRKAYNNVDGLKPTKTGKARIVPCTNDVYMKVCEFLQTLPISERQDECLIFANSLDKTKPVDESFCTKNFYKEMKNLGIKRVRVNPENGVEETICFHSLRLHEKRD